MVEWSRVKILLSFNSFVRDEEGCMYLHVTESKAASYDDELSLLYGFSMIMGVRKTIKAVQDDA